MFHRAFLVALSTLVLSFSSVVAAADPVSWSDVFDPFFRYGSVENKPLFQQQPGETVDPLTGNLRIVQEDFSLPGAAGLDLKLVRTYSSKIWGRVDIALMSGEPLLAETDQSVLGYGWTFHFGRLRDPNASGATGPCSSSLPIFEAPDGTSQVFYPQSDGSFLSREYWKLERGCSAMGGVGICVWSPSGVRYEFTGGANEYWHGMTLFYPVTAVQDPSGNRIAATYSNQSGSLSSLELLQLTDSYGRQVGFSYDKDEDGDRLTAVTVPTRAGTKKYSYHYTWYRTFAGLRRFLTDVQSPGGITYRYAYGISATLAQNQYALTTITYPEGGTTTYGYDARTFFAGNDFVQFSVVTSRTAGGYQISPATWNYEYNAPGPGQASSSNPQNLNVTTITDPDGYVDTYWMYGFGWVVDQHQGGFNYAVGLTQEIDRGNSAQKEYFGWDLRASQPIATEVYYTAPVYSSANTCGNYLADGSVYAPQMDAHFIVRDNPGYEVGQDTYAFQTQVSGFDDYGQPLTVTETGYDLISLPVGVGEAPLSIRVTNWSYFHVASDQTGTVNRVRGLPSEQHVCIGETLPCVRELDGSNRVDNYWTYLDTGYQLDSQTRSGVTTTLEHYPQGDNQNGPGNLRRVTNARGVSITLSGYATGHGIPTLVDYGSGSGTVYTNGLTASPEGWVLSETDGRNNTTTYDYDLDGRLKTLTPPTSSWPTGQGLSTSYTYSGDLCWQPPLSHCYVQVDRGTHREVQSLDGLGRAIGTSDSAGVMTSVQFDVNGRTSFKSYPYDAAGGAVGDGFLYDGLGRLTARRLKRLAGASLGGNYSTSYSYMANEQQIESSWAGADNHVLFTYAYQRWYGVPDEQRIWEVIDGNEYAWMYDYTAVDSLRAVHAELPKGDRSYLYDSHKFLKQETTGESGVTQFTPNEIGQIATRLDARGVLGVYGYDALSRPSGINYGGTPQDWWQLYDNSNNVHHAESQDGGAYEYGIDELNRVRTQTWTAPGVWSGGTSRSYVTALDYDGMGCPTSLTYPSGLRVTSTCDSDNRITSVSVNGTTVVSVPAYHPSGHPKQITYLDRQENTLTTTTFAFDNLARVKSISTPGVLDVAYTYDSLSNVLSQCRDAGDGSCLAAPPPATQTRTMTYDSDNRLMSVVTPQAGLWGALVYDYDALGNRILKSGYFDGTNDQTTIFNYDDKNRLSSTVGSERFRTMTFQWDAAGRLSWSSDGTSYHYDAHGWRVLKADATRSVVYHHDPSGRVIAETLADGTKLRDYVYLGNMLVAVDGCVTSDSPPCNEREYYYPDTLGSVLTRAGETGSQARLEYQPWGEQWSVSGVPGDRQYNGRVFDPGTGFHDYGARMYWPQIGRFISADSYAGDIGNPASLNRYSYVLNNPYRYSDPTGHQAEEGPEERMGEAGSEDIGAQFRYARQNAAIERIEKTGTRVTTMRAQGEAPSDEAVTQLERLADEVDPPKTDALPSLRTPRIPAKQIRAIWEKANPGKTWPFDDEMGRNQDAAHIKSLADGGTNDPSNVKPQPHGEHMEEHSKNGDFARWGRRATETRAKDEK